MTSRSFHARRLLLLLAGTSGAAVLLAGPAAAHIHPDPAAVEAGKPATVSFGVEHGCDGSPTTKVVIQLPDGSTDASGVDGDGFTSSTSGSEVTFTGGPLDAETEGTFTVAFTPPATPGEAEIKIVQTCEEGELAWIEPMGADGSEPEHPAPVLKLTAGAPTEADLAHEDEEDEDQASSGADDGSDPHAEHRGAASDDAHDETETASASKDDDDDSSGPVLLIGGLAAVAVVGAGGLLLARRGKGDTPST